jgi:diacylglycerol kinase family enzyme
MGEPPAIFIQDFFHILNPNKRHRKAVKNFFEHRPDARYQWVERNSHPTRIETIVEWAIQEGISALAVWGGDGTMNRAVQVLYERGKLGEIFVALIPVGTANDFSRKVNQAHWGKIAEKIFNEPFLVRDIDLGVLRCGRSVRVFVNNAGFGRESKALRRSRSRSLLDILSFRSKKLDLDWINDDSHYFECRDGILGIVFNAPYFNRGMHFDQWIEPDDNILNGFIEPPQGNITLFLRFLMGRLGRSLGSRRTFRLDGQVIQIRSDEKLFPQVDGESVSLDGVSEIKFSILPKALKLAF